MPHDDAISFVAQQDVTAGNYFDLACLDWLHSGVRRIVDWFEERGLISEARTMAQNVVSLRA